VITVENFAAPELTQLEEIQLSIYDSETSYYGGSQDWFPKKMHQLSGCGPVAAANITMYLAQAFPDKFKNLYPYEGTINKNDFVNHMVEIRNYVVPGLRGLTCVHKFVDNTLDFAQQKGISLTPHILEDDTAHMMEAVHYMHKALSMKLPVAILILTHPVKELEDYVWHWMTVTHLKLDPEENTYYIIVSTYGERRKIKLDLLWNNRRPGDDIRLVFFT
jgi:hypothetical protein